MMNSLLIISNKEDITVDFVVDKLNQKKLNYYRLNTEDLGKTLSIELDYQNGKYNFYDSFQNKVFDLLSFTSVYYRRPKSPTPPSELDINETEYFQNEHQYLLEGIYQLLSDSVWLNNVYSIRRAENKLYQLQIAKKIGFMFPQTLITNIPQKAEEFILDRKNAIFKSIKCGLISDDHGISRFLFTSAIDQHYLENINSITPLPTYYQEEICKEFDIRVTIVDNSVYAAKIDSQLFNETKTDWRNKSGLLPHQQIDLPVDVIRKCLNMCEILKLKFAAIDLVKDVFGNYYFIELNPNGQWAWIEKVLNYPISERIIDYLYGNGDKDELF